MPALLFYRKRPGGGDSAAGISRGVNSILKEVITLTQAELGRLEGKLGELDGAMDIGNKRVVTDKEKIVE